MRFEIETIDNGYILRKQREWGAEEANAYRSVEELLQAVAEKVLYAVTGKSKHFHNALYGAVTVTVNYTEPEEDDGNDR